jgi:hypothetical protein
MNIDRHDEDGITLSDWHETSLFPPPAADENSSSTDAADGKRHKAVFRMIQNESLDRTLKRHHLTGQGVLTRKLLNTN